MSSWLQRLRGRHDTKERPNTSQGLQPERRRSVQHGRKDPNLPQKRLQLHQKLLYERTLPGEAYVSAHVNRLAHGFYENSNAIHEPALNNVYFVSCHFVFHPSDPRAHRFKRAVIKVSVHGDLESRTHYHQEHHGSARPCPRILKHAPELIYGAVSPENLQWNFSLSSSLGVSQAPLTASLNPTGGVKSAYKIYDMMSIQGSLRSLKSPLGPDYDVDDAVAVWTLEENRLQRSGLPREFDFVLLVHRPDHVQNVFLTVDVDAWVDSFLGDYPQWYTNTSKYLPTQDLSLDFTTDVGQRFVPSHPGKGFNFADLPRPLEEYVIMPGTVYPANDTGEGRPRRRSGRTFDHEPRDDNTAFERNDNDRRPIVTSPPPSSSPITPRRSVNPGLNRRSWAASDTLNVRVLLEHSYPQTPSSRRFSSSPLDHQEPTRRQSIRRRRSRSELKEYSAQQALEELARETIRGDEENGRRRNINHSPQGRF